MSPDLRLAIPVATAWAALAVIIGAPPALAPAAIGCWAAAALSAGAATFWRRSRAALGVITVTFAAVALLVSVAAAQQPARQPSELSAAASAGRFITATITTSEQVTPSTTQFAANLDSVKIGDSTLRVHVPVLVFTQHGSAQPGDSSDAHWGIGASIRIGGTLAKTDPADDLSYLLFARGSPVTLADPPWYLDWANGLRGEFSRAAASLPGDGGDLLPGLAIGDTGAVSAELDGAMKATSLSHLTAVSGANCAVVIALVMLAARGIGLSRTWRIAAAIVVLLGFVVLVTPQPSVLRSAVMATLVLVAFLGGRPVRGIPILALATLLLLAIDPWLARSYGFVLSVLATGGLLLLAGPIAALLGRVIPRALAAVVAIPLAAQLACQPVLILLNPSIPTYGVVANMLAEPAAPVATVLGLIACLILPVVPALGGVFVHLAWLPSAWIAAVARFFADAPGSSIPWPPGAPGLALVAVLTILSLLIAFAPAPMVRLIAAFGLAFALVVSLGVAVGTRVTAALDRPTDWQIAACDIGQGDAVLVRSAGQVALIDAGPDPKLLTRCLGTLAIDRIDLLILTHYDLDHVGGTSAVLGRAAQVLIGPPDGAKGDRLLAQLLDAGEQVTQVSTGLNGRLGELAWEILWRDPLRGTEPGNDASVTVRFTGEGACGGGCLSSIFLGDLGEESQSRMLAANRIAEVDVVKVAHHGSADQNERLYAALKSPVGLISVGADNDYGHPNDRLLGILDRVGTRAERTDLQGMILVSPRPDGTMSVWSEHPLPAAKRTQH